MNVYMIDNIIYIYICLSVYMINIILYVTVASKLPSTVPRAKGSILPSCAFDTAINSSLCRLLEFSPAIKQTY